ncbi:hypothetical protein CRG98_025168 [Punica granatum]|uniref:RNase H type-1 domain-containing protein n=1 Tax=Punica granatum TaxID=22663 RepID=A0A2I0JDQ3_PUNGR|nr:hypothetical protein CRG98_025168 [Punica granatum]
MGGERRKKADLSDSILRIKRSFKQHSNKQTPREHFDPRLSSDRDREAAHELHQDQGWAHINTDAAWIPDIACLAGFMHLPYQPISCSWNEPAKAASPLQAEAKAALLPISLALDRGWRKIWIRTDALLLGDAFHRTHPPAGDIRSIMSDIDNAASR